jgi:hypothetical protein
MGRLPGGLAHEADRRISSVVHMTKTDSVALALRRFFQVRAGRR